MDPTQTKDFSTLCESKLYVKTQLSTSIELESIDSAVSGVSAISGFSTVSATSGSSNISNIQLEARGPEGQTCQNKDVLNQILTKYVHTHVNLFKGGATGKIRAEYMICECRYDHCTFLTDFSD